MLKKILLVDDEPDLREIIQFLIESEFNCTIIAASSGNEAIEILKANSDIDLIVSDYSMPNGNGGTLFQYNVAHNNIPFMLVTGGYFDDYEDLAGFTIVNPKNQILQKPINEDILISSIKMGLS